MMIGLKDTPYAGHNRYYRKCEKGKGGEGTRERKLPATANQ
jgi:hypothetical protein